MFISKCYDAIYFEINSQVNLHFAIRQVNKYLQFNKTLPNEKKRVLYLKLSFKYKTSVETSFDFAFAIFSRFLN